VPEQKISKIVAGTSDAISIRYNNIVYELKNKGKDIIVLSLGEAFFDIPLYSFDSLSFPDIYHYSHSRGILELREKISEYYEKHYKVLADADNEILVTAGSKIAIYLAFKALLNPGDEVVISEPAWVSYTEQAKLCQAVPVSIPYYETVFNYEKYLTSKTKLIVINNPNNPSGKVYTKAELEYLLELARSKNLYILSDEAYSDFVWNEKFISLGKLDNGKKHTIICNSISKNFGISGWRIGYTITNEELTNELLKLNQHLVTCAPTILQHYLIEYFDDIYEVTRPQLKALDYLPGTAAFYFFVSIRPTKLSSEEFCMRLLREEGISAVPGIGYGSSCDSFIRISVGSESIERIKYALSRIKHMIDTSCLARVESAQAFLPLVDQL
jgi:aspartate aminotransferase/aminotransferase